MICLPSPIVLKYRLAKERNELLGHPVVMTFLQGFVILRSCFFLNWKPLTLQSLMFLELFQ